MGNIVIKPRSDSGIQSHTDACCLAITLLKTIHNQLPSRTSIASAGDILEHCAPSDWQRRSQDIVGFAKGLVAIQWPELTKYEWSALDGTRDEIVHCAGTKAANWHEWVSIITRAAVGYFSQPAVSVDFVQKELQEIASATSSNDASRFIEDFCPEFDDEAIVAELRVEASKATRWLEAHGHVEASDASANSDEANHSDDFRSVNWYGAEHSFSANQALAIRILWENLDRGTPDLADETILNAIDHHSPPSNLRNVFRVKRLMHPAWGTMITSENKGSHRLTPPSRRNGVSAK